MKKGAADLETQLAEIRQAIQELKSTRILPTAFTYQEAARQLSIGLTTLRSMVAAGKIQTTKPIGRRKRIPLSEILRVAMPEPKRPKTKSSLARRSVKTDSEDLRVWLKEQNKKGQ